MKKLLNFLSMNLIISSITTSIVSCSENKNNIKPKPIDKRIDLTKLKLESYDFGDVFKTKNINLIDNIFSQIAKFGNISLDQLKQIGYDGYIMVEDGSGNLSFDSIFYFNGDNSSSEINDFIASGKDKVEIFTEDTKYFKDCDFITSMDVTTTKKDVSNTQINTFDKNVNLYSDATNRDLDYQIDKILVKYIPLPPNDDLYNPDPTYLEMFFNILMTNSRGESFNHNSSDRFLDRKIIKGNLNVKIDLNKELESPYIYKLDKEIDVNFKINTSDRKKSLDNFTLNAINLDKNDCKNTNVLVNIEEKISMFTNVDINKIKNDNDLFIEIIESDGTKFSTDTKDWRIMDKKAIIGKTQITVSVLDTDKYFTLSNPLKFNIDLNISDKINIDSFNFSDIELTQKNHSQYDLLNNLKKQLAEYLKIDFNIINDDIKNNNDIYIKATTSDGKSIDTKSQTVITPNVLKGLTKIELSVTSNDKYVYKFNDKIFNVNLNY